tara:strand:+ start:654 stop:1127 length:474 start_codon:yes stop_codon:yes gene_type:complete
MNNNFLNIYNNLIKLTRNKYIFENISNKETFSDRLTIFFFHFAFFLKVYKNQTSKKDLQNLYDFVFKQIELSIREIGYGDSSVNKKMKLYVNLMFSIINKVELWKKLNLSEKTKFLSDFVEVKKESPFFINYFNKYEDYLSKKSLNYFTKDVISHKF